jgi:cobalt/nickel transport system permease protein
MIKHFLEAYLKLESPVHRLDPALKLVAALIFMIIIVLTRGPFIIYSGYFVALAVVILISRIPLNYVIKRSLVILPFVVMISFFTLFTGNMDLFWNALAKSFLCTMSMMVVVATTKFNDMLKALQIMKVPKILILTLSFMYRYIFLLLNELETMLRAKESRTCGGSWWLHMRTYANIAGSLFLRTYTRGENVYLAMCARGFDGKVR